MPRKRRRRCALAPLHVRRWRACPDSTLGGPPASCWPGRTGTEPRAALEAGGTWTAIVVAGARPVEIAAAIVSGAGTSATMHNTITPCPRIIGILRAGVVGRIAGAGAVHARATRTATFALRAGTADRAPAPLASPSLLAAQRRSLVGKRGEQGSPERAAPRTVSVWRRVTPAPRTRTSVSNRWSSMANVLRRRESNNATVVPNRHVSRRNCGCLNRRTWEVGLCRGPSEA